MLPDVTDDPVDGRQVRLPVEDLASVADIRDGFGRLGDRVPGWVQTDEALGAVAVRRAGLDATFTA